MIKLGNGIVTAFDDAGRAEVLLSGAQGRRIYRDEPDRMLRSFDTHRQEIDLFGARKARAERRDLAVRAAFRMRQSGAPS